MVVPKKDTETIEEYIARALPIFFDTEVIPYIKYCVKRDNALMKAFGQPAEEKHE